MPARAGARPFQSRWKREPVTRLQESAGVFAPCISVKIDGEKMARFVLEHRIDAHDEVVPLVISTREMVLNSVVGDWEKPAVWTLDALNLALVAQIPDPFVGARWLVAGLASFPAFEAAGVYVHATSEKRPKQGNLGGGFGTPRDRIAGGV